MKMLVSDESPLLMLDDRNKTARNNYTAWKMSVNDNLQQVLEYRRMANEVNDLEKNVRELEHAFADSTRELNDAKDHVADLESQVASIRDLRDSARRWAESASRLAGKRMQVFQKETDLHSATADTRGRDLRTVENELNERNEKREQHINQVSRH